MSQEVSALKATLSLAAWTIGSGVVYQACLWGGRKVLKMAYSTDSNSADNKANQANQANQAKLSNWKRTGCKIAGYFLLTVGFLGGALSVIGGGFLGGMLVTSLFAITPLAKISPLLGITTTIGLICLNTMYLIKSLMNVQNEIDMLKAKNLGASAMYLQARKQQS